MIEQGWRTILVHSKTTLSYSEGSLLMQQEGHEYSVPLAQIRTIIIDNPSIVLNAALMNRFIAQGIKVILCNEKHQPCADLLAYSDHTNSAGNIMKQSKWKRKDKQSLWNQIVLNKINNQITALRVCNHSETAQLQALIDNAKDQEFTRSEAVAAKMYFAALFGSNFCRRTDSNINAMLNYGYSIILSHTTRSVSSFGYHPAMGVQHHSVNNPFNLSCDFMEPFRPFVDVYAFKHQEDAFTFESRRDLVMLMDTTVIYSEKQLGMQAAIEQYVHDCIRYMNHESSDIGEVSFVAA